MPPPRPARRRSLPLRLVLALVRLVCAVVVLLDELMRPLYRPLIRRISALRLVQRAEVWIGRQPPLLVLVLIAVPYVVVEPAKFVTLLWIADGHVRTGTLAFLLANLVSFLLIERVFSAGRAQLMQLPPAAWLITTTDTLRLRIVSWLRLDALKLRLRALLRVLRMRLRWRGAPMKTLAPDLAYRLLESGPVVLVTTAHNGRANIMTMGFHMVIQHAPPLIGAIIGPWDHSYRALVETGECVIAIPAADLAQTMVDIGNCSGSEVDKFARFGLTALPAREVAAPLVGECLANLECRVVDDSLADRYGLHILEVVAIHYDAEHAERRLLHHNGDGTFTLDGPVVDLRERMVLWKQFQVDL